MTSSTYYQHHSNTRLLSIQGTVHRGTLVEPICKIDGMVTMCNKRVISGPVSVHVIIDANNTEYGTHWFPEPIQEYHGFRVRVDNVTDIVGSTITFAP